MGETWTAIQKRRLHELNASVDMERTFADCTLRDQAYREEEARGVCNGRRQLETLRQSERRPGLIRLAEKLAAALIAEGFTQVATPTMISKRMLAKMTIDETHPLFSQVFWLSRNQCLRPMLAPNLYYVSKDLLRLWPSPVRIFEIGSCFRKESQGSTHLNEFTMLNLVEWGLPEEERFVHLKHFAELVMQTADLSDFSLETETSVVYGDTVDVICRGIEAASGAVGPHPLDGQWGITSTWVGLGFGLERLLMLQRGGQNVKGYSKSISYLDGVRLNI